MTLPIASSPDAPGRFWITTEALTPRCLAMKGARVRTITSVAPPGANPTVIAMGASDGQAACASDAAASAQPARPARKREVKEKEKRIFVSVCCVYVDGQAAF